RPAASAAGSRGARPQGGFPRPRPSRGEPPRASGERPRTRREAGTRWDPRLAVGLAQWWSAVLDLDLQLLELGFVLARVVSAEQQLAAGRKHGANLGGRSAAVATVEGG